MPSLKTLMLVNTAGIRESLRVLRIFLASFVVLLMAMSGFICLDYFLLLEQALTTEKLITGTISPGVLLKFVYYDQQLHLLAMILIKKPSCH